MTRRRVVAACGGTVALAVAGLVYLAEPASSSSYAFVDGQRVALHGRAPTVRSVLDAANRRPRDGALRSVMSGRVLDPHRSPAVVLLRGLVTERSARVHPGDLVTVIDGADAVEPTEVRTEALPPPPLPDVERSLWHPGTAGAAEVEFGAVSGEIVRQIRVVTPATPPRPETGKVVALTFDDGPSPVWTPQILTVLADKHVPATFCLVGYAIRWMPAMPAVEVAQGHTVCNHTADHVEHLDARPHDEVVGEIGRGTNAIAAALGGTRPLFYRPPGGSLSPDVIAVAHGHGERVITWSVDPDDFRHPPAAVLLDRILSRVQPGSIILLHDGGGDRSQTVAVLAPLIDTLRAEGYEFVTPYVT